MEKKEIDEETAVANEISEIYDMNGIPIIAYIKKRFQLTKLSILGQFDALDKVQSLFSEECRLELSCLAKLPEVDDFLIKNKLAYEMVEKIVDECKTLTLEEKPESDMDIVEHFQGLMANVKATKPVIDLIDKYIPSEEQKVYIDMFGADANSDDIESVLHDAVDMLYDRLEQSVRDAKAMVLKNIKEEPVLCFSFTKRLLDGIEGLRSLLQEDKELKQDIDFFLEEAKKKAFSNR